MKVKKVLSIILAIAMIMGTMGTYAFAENEASVWDGSVDTSWYNDTDSAFTLESAAALAGFASLVNDGTSFAGKEIDLMTNVDLDQVDWVPIGGGEKGNQFFGTFDGNEHTVSNLWVTSSYSNLGLFGYIGGNDAASATVKNLIVDNATVINQSADGVAAAVGYSGSSGYIDNVTVTGELNIKGYRGVAAILGKGYADINNCHVKNASGTIATVFWCAGGIVGHCDDACMTVTNCSVIGSTDSDLVIDGGSYNGAGAICGYIAENAVVDTVQAENVTVEGDNYYYGGILCGNGIVAENGTYKNVSFTVADAAYTPHDALPCVAKIGDVEYADIQSAADAAVSGDTITLLADAEIAEGTDVTIPDGVTLDGNGFSILASGADHDTGTSFGYVVAGGELTIKGVTKIEKFSPSYYDHIINIGQGASLQVTGKNRVSLAYGTIFNIEGTIADAKTADKANELVSLSIPAGISITGGNDAAINAKNAYISIGGTSSKNSSANGVFDLDFDNCIAEFTNYLTFATPTSGKTPTFNVNVKDSVMTTAAKLCNAAPNGNIVIDNSAVTLGTYLHNSGTITLKNSSSLTGSTIQFGENGGNAGAINVDASSFVINCTSTGHAFDGNSIGSITLTNGATANVTYLQESIINVDGSSKFTATKLLSSNVVNVDGTNLVAGENVVVFEQTDSNAESLETITTLSNADGVTATYDGGDISIYKTASAAAKIGDVSYATIQEAIDAAVAGDEIVLISDIELSAGATVAADDEIVLDLNGYTLSGVTANTGSSAVITNRGKLTVKDSSTAKTGKITSEVLNPDTSSIPSYANNTIANGGEFILESGTIENKTESGSACYAIDTIWSTEDVSITINGGKVVAVKPAIRVAAWYAGSKNTVTVNGGELVGSRAIWIHLPSSNNEVKDVDVNITGGTLTSTDEEYNLAIYSYSFGDAYSGVDVTVSAGTINGNIAVGGGSSYNGTGAENVVITGGTISGEVFTYNTKTEHNIEISGGLFGGDITEGVADGYVAIKNLDGYYVVGEAPTATVKNLGALTVPKGEYKDLKFNTITDKDMELSFVMQFLADQDAEDMETSPYADWYADFVITFTGLENGSFDADGCYLAGYYGDFGWIQVPVDDMTVKEGARYPVMLGYGAGQKYDYICEGVKDFRCAMYLTPEILAANPNLKVNLELSLVDNSKGSNAALEELTKVDGSFHKVGDTEYVAEDFETEENGISDSIMLIHNMKLEDGLYPIHMYAGIDSLDYKEVGFKMTVTNSDIPFTGTEEASTETVYKSMTVTNASGTKTRYEASQLGGAKYMFGHAMYFNPDNKWKNSNTTIEITPYAIRENGKKIFGRTITVTDAAIKDKMPDSALFREEKVQ